MGQDIEEARLCKRCLTREMAGQEEYFHTLWEYIENLDKDIKAPESLYQDRLEVCKKCEMLLAGMCRCCGCYVELRAAIEKNRCPREHW